MGGGSPLRDEELKVGGSRGAECGYPSVERGEAAVVRNRECQQMSVGHQTVVSDGRRIHGAAHHSPHLIGPELVPGLRGEQSEHFHSDGRGR